MADEVKQAFDRSADIYDRSRRQLLPCFDDFYATALERLPFAADAAIDILDLGAGTGLLSQFIAGAYPRARLTLVDVSDEMLARARARFADRQQRVTFVCADFEEVALEGRFDAVVSALAIHHLDDEGKQRLFSRLHAALRPGGVFVNADQVLGPTPAAEDAYQEAWLLGVRARGVSEDDLEAAMARMRADRAAPLEHQLSWLRAAGFSDVDCWFKHYRFAVYSGTKPPA